LNEKSCFDELNPQNLQFIRGRIQEIYNPPNKFRVKNKDPFYIIPTRDLLEFTNESYLFHQFEEKIEI